MIVMAAAAVWAVVAVATIMVVAAAIITAVAAKGLRRPLGWMSMRRGIIEGNRINDAGRQVIRYLNIVALIKHAKGGL